MLLENLVKMKKREGEIGSIAKNLYKTINVFITVKNQNLYQKTRVCPILSI